MKKRVLRRNGRHTVSGDKQAEQILRCTRNVLREHGAGGFSVRKVSQAAGISLGHLQHYFPTRADLLRAVLVQMEQQFHEYYASTIAVIRDPVKRLDACAIYLLGDVAASGTAVLREFWSLAARDEEVAEAIEDFYTGFRRFTTRLVQEANPVLDEPTSQQVSATLIAALSGAFIFIGKPGSTADKEALISYLKGLPAQLTFTSDWQARSGATG